jgi:mRNA interferase HigB
VLIRNEPQLKKYAASYPDAADALRRWAELTKRAAWRNLAETRQIFPHADQVCECAVFNIKGNHYRLITKINYGLQTVTLVNFLTHKEYDRDKWKKDCGG